ncbi:hypothetical protein BU26DRAFT_127961 [Trematosphaeria pertusa]|uniref:Uncharacterized protein n=1 Tax=Trematosphaeria pertusa TaxID=390896 RepID=A0A6A6HY45_9PLEO|nr:uncharacterized protein BU26DRAFT_127961 [Trematosphaeria pertusa]KAF2242523.1 hypothetical protein BU26DRAFT_127961 [Trematosphaeria pertusa]
MTDSSKKKSPCVESPHSAHIARRAQTTPIHHRSQKSIYHIFLLSQALAGPLIMQCIPLPHAPSLPTPLPSSLLYTLHSTISHRPLPCHPPPYQPPQPAPKAPRPPGTPPKPPPRAPLLPQRQPRLLSPAARRPGELAARTAAFGGGGEADCAAGGVGGVGVWEGFGRRECGIGGGWGIAEGVGLV